jgi:hypothetical protein
MIMGDGIIEITDKIGRTEETVTATVKWSAIPATRLVTLLEIVLRKVESGLR